MNEKQKRKVLNELNRMSAKVGLFCYKDYEENVENGVADSCPCPECKWYKSSSLMDWCRTYMASTPVRIRTVSWTSLRNSTSNNLHTQRNMMGADVLIVESIYDRAQPLYRPLVCGDLCHTRHWQAVMPTGLSQKQNDQNTATVTTALNTSWTLWKHSRWKFPWR